MAEGPKFALYVRPVAGHLVPRYGTREYLGARVTADGVVWDEKQIIPLTEEYERTYRKELLQDIETGALKKATEEEFSAQCKAEEQQQADRLEKENEAKKRAAATSNEGKSKGNK